MEFFDIDTLRSRPGLRLVLVQGVPSPWGQAAKAMMEYKNLEYSAGLQISGGTNEALVDWSGVNSAPVVAWKDEPPINGWLDILNLLERLAPELPLLPQSRAERAEAVGLSNELCGDDGLGWNRRLSLFRPAFNSGEPPERVVRVSAKYRYNDRDAANACAKQIAVLELLGQKLKAQRARGSEFFVGDSITAVDYYWTAFANIMHLPPPEMVPVDPQRRPQFERIEPEVMAALIPELLDHRDRILERYFRLPMEF